jgi:outer membrane immunogenic protein
MLIMKAILLAGIGLLAFAATGTPASAADLPVKAPVYKAPPVLPYSWAGFYLGGNVGYSWGRSHSTLTLSDATSGAVLSSNSANFNLDGVIGGGQIGYNWQSNNWVFGLEADIQASGEKGGTNTSCAGGPGGATTTAGAVDGTCSLGHIGDTVAGNISALPVTDSLSEKIKWFGTVRGRIGPTITPTILAYVTGGLAYGQVSATDTISGVNLVGPQGVNGGTLVVPVSASFGSSTTKVGWTIGAGIECVLGGNWTGKIEYLYVDLGKVSGSFVTPIVAPSGAFLASSFSSHITDNILRVGINYKFGYAPVVAGY